MQTAYDPFEGDILSPCYNAIALHYGDKRTKRSGVLLMDHIDQGLTILRAIGATVFAQAGFCLHPILQANKDLTDFWYSAKIRYLEPRAILLAMEYRSAANRWLLPDGPPPRMVLVSPLDDVRNMLIADKVQNRKDFELYHKATHEKSAELDAYFKGWLDNLLVPEHRYIALKELIISY